MSPEVIAFIAEDVAIDGRGPVATGLYTCSIQTDDGRIGDAIGEPLPLAAAVRWGHERAELTVVTLTIPTE